MRFDAILVGGGLQSALIALALLEVNPDARIAVVEREARLGGNHTWSFHASDLSARMRETVRPLVTAAWPACEVAFPGFRRRMATGYASISSRRLHDVVTRRLAAAPHAQTFLSAQAVTVTPDCVVLASGVVLSASLVVDSRGPAASSAGDSGYQKFVGLELELDADHGLELPMIMDAEVEQLDGFRFIYVLPFTARRLLIEDTCYSDTPLLDVPALAERVLRYAATLGLKAPRTMRTETGVLPIPLSLASAPADDGILRGGVAGGFFHPATGYSLPVAAALAELVADTLPATLSSARLAALRQEQGRQRRFAVALNRLLFRAYRGADRWRALERFYRLPLSTIERFYALRTRRLDRARILLGRPPRGVRLGNALHEMVLYARSS